MRGVAHDVAEVDLPDAAGEGRGPAVGRAGVAGVRRGGEVERRHSGDVGAAERELVLLVGEDAPGEAAEPPGAPVLGDEAAAGGRDGRAFVVAGKLAVDARFWRALNVPRGNKLLWELG